MSTAPAPKVSRAPSISLIWIVPVAALVIGGWMVFGELRNRGPEITIEFAESSGVEADKTVLVYKGVVVGKVSSVVLRNDLRAVDVRVQLAKKAAGLATADAKFWVVHPEIGLSGIRGVDTLVTGVRLHMRPGSGPPSVFFQGLEREPPAEDNTAGRAYMLQSDRLGALTPGAPVYYREVKVGMVETTRLGDDSTGVLVRIRIFTPFVNLVRTNTQFWNAGGVSLKVGLLGAEIKSTSLESLIVGGIAFATPDNAETMPVAPDGAIFKLNGDADKEWLKWQPKISIKSPETSPESSPKEPNVPSLLKQL
jgi:paraquat-inducible protein B